MSRKSLPYFDFKQFRVYHDRCAQKVGTDGVVLGAWAKIDHAKHILDIGTGSGLIAMMVAQRAPMAQVTAIDIDEDAVDQARENVAASPFASRIDVVQADVRKFNAAIKYQSIVCNPPFYVEDTLPPDESRALARNAALLPFVDLVRAASAHLDEGGYFSVMLPTDVASSFTITCQSFGLSVHRICTVQTVARKAPKRTLITYSNIPTQSIERESLILQEGNEKSAVYRELAKDFYL